MNNSYLRYVNLLCMHKYYVSQCRLNIFSDGCVGGGQQLIYNDFAWCGENMIDTDWSKQEVADLHWFNENPYLVNLCFWLYAALRRSNCVWHRNTVRSTAFESLSWFLMSYAKRSARHVGFFNSAWDLLGQRESRAWKHVFNAKCMRVGNLINI